MPPLPTVSREAGEKVRLEEPPGRGEFFVHVWDVRPYEKFVNKNFRLPESATLKKRVVFAPAGIKRGAKFLYYSVVSKASLE